MKMDKSPSPDSVEESRSSSPKMPSTTTTTKWSPQFLHDTNRKSAFQPYKNYTTNSAPPPPPPTTTTTTVLTNLQRGNTQAETLIPKIQKLTYHMKAGQGSLTSEDILKEENVDIKDTNGLTALHWSAAYGQFNTVENLLNFQADSNKFGPEEETPLTLAANGGHHEVVKLLLNHDQAQVDHMDHLCNTPLMYAAKGNHPHTCQELLTHGANFGLINLSEQTALDIAIENNSTSAQAVIENFIISYMENQAAKINNKED